jgi:pyrophosphatase PpaX
MALKAMIFDLDGTLGNTMPIVVQAMQETFLRYSGMIYSPDEIFQMFGPSEEGVFGPRVAPEVYDEAIQDYLTRYTNLHTGADRPFPGIIDLLELLIQLRIHRGVVTGKGSGTARISMVSMGLEPYIERLEAGTAAGADKPAAMRHLLKEWHLLPEEAAYVGDMPYDMWAAREVGMVPLGAAWADSATVDENSGAKVLFKRVEELWVWVTDHHNDFS